MEEGSAECDDIASGSATRKQCLERSRGGHHHHCWPFWEELKSSCCIFAMTRRMTSERGDGANPKGKYHVYIARCRRDYCFG